MLGMSTPIQWLSTAEAAKYLGITPRTLYRFIDEGQIAGYRFGPVETLPTYTWLRSRTVFSAGP